MLSAASTTHHTRGDEVALLVLFLGSFAAVFWITLVDVRRVWRQSRSWGGGTAYRVVVGRPRLLVVSYGVLFLWVKVTLLVIGIGGHVSSSIVMTSRYLVASAAVGVVLNNEVAQRLRMALCGAAGAFEGGGGCRSREHGVTLKGATAVAHVALIIGLSSSAYFAVAGGLLLNGDTLLNGVGTSTVAVDTLALGRMALSLSFWVAIMSAAVAALLLAV